MNARAQTPPAPYPIFADRHACAGGPARVALPVIAGLSSSRDDYQVALDELLYHAARIEGRRRTRRLLEMLEAIAAGDLQGRACRALLALLPHDQPLVARRISLLLDDTRLSPAATQAVLDFLALPTAVAAGGRWSTDDLEVIERFVHRCLRDGGNARALGRAMQCYVRVAARPHALLGQIARHQECGGDARSEAVRALGMLRDDEAIALLAALFGTCSCPRLRWQAAVQMAACDAAARLLRDLALSGPGDRRAEATRALGRCRGGEVEAALLACAHSPLGTVRREAITCLARRHVQPRRLRELLEVEPSAANRQFLEGLLGHSPRRRLAVAASRPARLPDRGATPATGAAG